MLNGAAAHIRDLVYDQQQHFSARWLHEAAWQAGMDPEILAFMLCGVFMFCLLKSAHAGFVANMVLIVVPLLVTHRYPRERPHSKLLVTYWASYAILTLFDSTFKTEVPGYWFLKVMLLSLMFLRPVNGARSMYDLFERTLALEEPTGPGVREEQPLPPTSEKPLTGRTSTAVRSTKTFSTTTANTQAPTSTGSVGKSLASGLATFLNMEVPQKKISMRLPPKEEARKSVKEPNSPVVRDTGRSMAEELAKHEQPPSNSEDSETSKNSTRAPIESPASASTETPKPPATSTGITSAYFPVGSTNPMLNDSKFAITPGHSASSTSSVEGPHNPDDLVFRPMNRIVFNAPFNEHTLAYHMTVKNNSTRWIAFAIKSNAIPRLTADPPCGILKPQQKAIISINLQAFNFNEVDTSKDRIAYDYVFCPPDTKEFAHPLLQGNQTRRRKNIRVDYNP